MGEKVNFEVLVRANERARRLSLGLPVPIIRSELPCGYVVNPENKDEAIIDPVKFDLLKQARKYIKDSSFYEVAAWLTKNGLPISPNGLHKLMTHRTPYTDDERLLYLSST